MSVKMTGNDGTSQLSTEIVITHCINDCGNDWKGQNVVERRNRYVSLQYNSVKYAE